MAPPAGLEGLSPHAVLQRLLISLETAAQPLALILDDYHLLKNPVIHQALAAFLDRLRLLQALAAPGQARSILEPLLPAALRQKLARSILDLGPQAVTLLEALRLPAEPELARRFAGLVQACQGGSLHVLQPPGEALPGLPELPPLIEPLSVRELEALRLLAAGCSTREIAARLFVTESTVIEPAYRASCPTRAPSSACWMWSTTWA